MNISINPYFILEGTAKEAVDFYAEVFEAEIDSCNLLKDWPHEFKDGIPKGYENNVMHAHLNIGKQPLMLADALPGQQVQKGSTITLLIDLQKVEDTKQLFERLAQDGQVIEELKETSYSPAYAQVKDKFGIEWQLITEFPEGVDE